MEHLLVLSWKGEPLLDKKKGNKYLNLLCPLLIIAVVLLIAPHLAPTVLPRLQSYSTISRYWSFNSMPGHFSAIDVS